MDKKIRKQENSRTKRIVISDQLVNQDVRGESRNRTGGCTVPRLRTITGYYSTKNRRREICGSDISSSRFLLRTNLLERFKSLVNIAQNLTSVADHCILQQERHLRTA
jgi:hypothetical protein